MSVNCTCDKPCQLEVKVADLLQQVEDYKAANTELRYQLELAREEANQAYKRADQYRAQASALGDRFSAVCAMNADLQRTLDEANND